MSRRAGSPGPVASSRAVRLVGPPRVEVYEPGKAARLAGLDEELLAPGILQNPVPVRGLFDAAVASELDLRNRLQRYGYESLEEVHDAGEAEGIAEGKAEGLLEGKADVLLKLPGKRGVALTSDERARITSCRDVALLDRWCLRVLDATTGAEVFE